MPNSSRSTALAATRTAVEALAKITGWRWTRLVKRTKTPWLSDHLCWGSVGGKCSHDLLPMPYTKGVAKHTARKIRQAQDFLEVPICVENVSSYAEFTQNEMTEWEFLSELSRRSGCWLLFDVNNVYVSAFNHDFDARTFLRAMPKERVRQFHLAGHTHKGSHIIDTHDHPIVDDVWSLYEEAVRLFPGVPTMIERDADIPPYAELVAELDIARRLAAGTRREAAE